MVLSASAVIERVKLHASVLRRLGVRRLALFGSVARGETRDTSDLDFLVELEPCSFDAYMDLKFLLEDEFARRVDLVTVGGLKPAIRDRVLAESIDVPGL
jgi:hypothetical protein